MSYDKERVKSMKTEDLISEIEESLSWDDGVECAVPEEFYELIKRFGYEKVWNKKENSESS